MSSVLCGYIHLRSFDGPCRPKAGNRKAELWVANHDDKRFAQVLLCRALVSDVGRVTIRVRSIDGFDVNRD